ncbi:MAG: hypothetical protein JRZ94_04545 [Nitrososphaerota archaeon]|nr:hypothetical protein [Nitrososphaerota archaeon]
MVAEIFGAGSVAAEVVGGFIAFVGFIGPFISGGFVILLFVIQFLINVLSWVLYSLAEAVLVPLDGILSGVFYDADEVIDDLTHDKFDSTPPIRKRNGGNLDFAGTMILFFNEIRDIVVDISVYLSPLFIAFPALFIIGFGITLLVLLGWVSSPLVFAIVQLGYTSFIITLQGIAIAGNFIFTFIDLHGPVISAFVTLFMNLAKALIAIVCSGTPYTGDPSHDCPLLWALWMFTVTSWDFFWQLAQQLWALIVELWISMGDTLCPPDGSNCDVALCMKYLNIPSCSWGFNFAMQLIVSLLYEMAVVFVWILLILVFFCFDVFAMTVSKFYLFVSWIAPPNFMAGIRNLANIFGSASTSLSNLYVPQVFNDTKAVFLVFEDIVNVLETVFSNAMVSIFGIVDGFFCYLFRAPIDCIVAKACFALIHDTTISFTILKSTFYIPVPLQTDICVNTLHLNAYACAGECDSCAVQYFGIPVISQPFFTYANIVHQNGNMNAPYGYIPCNLQTGCCNPQYTILQSLTR